MKASGMWLSLSRRDHENDFISDEGKVELSPVVCLINPAKGAKGNIASKFVLTEAYGFNVFS